MECLAVKYLENGYTACESVLLAYADKIGIEKDFAIKLASGYSGGIAGTKKYLCGAINSAILILNIKYGGEDIKNKTLVEKKIKIFLTFLEMKHRSFLCKDILMENNMKYEMNSQKCVVLLNEICNALDRVME